MLKRGAGALAIDPIFRTTALILAIFVVLDRAILRLATVPRSSLSDRSLVLAALRSNWLLVIIGVGAIFLLKPSRLAATTWHDVGRPLRPLAGILIALVVWRRGAGAFDYIYDQWHLVDRFVLVGVAGIAMFRPVAVILVAIVVRVLAAPMLETVFAPGNNIVELPVLMLIAIGAASLVARRKTEHDEAAIVPVLTAAIAAQFFLPGLTKLRSGWAWNNPVANLPLNGHAQGWLGGGSGDLASSMSDVMSSTEILFIVGTLAFELGGVVALLRNRFFGVWLMSALVFHVGAYLALGFIFFEFIVVELAMLALVWSRRGRAWAAPGFGGAAPFLGAAAAILASTFFHPPTLAWYDGPVATRYDIDGTDAEGRVWALDSDDFAPYDGLMAFAGLDLGPTPPLASGYGAVSRLRFEQLAELTELKQFTALAAQLPATCDVTTRRLSVLLLERFLLESGNVAGRTPLGLPLHFPTDRAGPNRPDSLRLERLDVARTTVVRIDGTEHDLVEEVLTVALDPTGTTAATTWHVDPNCRSDLGP